MSDEESEDEESGSEEEEVKSGGADEDDENSDEVSAVHAACRACSVQRAAHASFPRSPVAKEREQQPSRR
jgi:hypothetical protein